ncbi:MAG: hypothetical protein L7S51_00375 [Candidatus Marinimicrobia bacterium]|jgi:hypothetical protein|nr:hypothetical protein [Candidatus Neomarinimicrobiota bacterium]|tara:strand:+ start:730 stop:1515 length:786 start_codon:yes stop_codon:yes gene_type:complete
MKKLLSLIVLTCSILNAQTHIIPEGFTGFSVSFKHDQNVDFFGEGKFLRDSYGNGLGIGYIYDGTFGIDLEYGYSFFDRKDAYSFLPADSELPEPSEDEYFNFVENFRSENAGIGDKGFSFGLTYYINENQTLFDQALPVNLSLGFRYGSASYSSNALNYLDQDFYGKFYSLEFGVYKEIETSASFYMIPRIKLNITNEKNIHDSLTEDNDTESFSLSSNYFEIALPFILNNTSVGQPFVEPSIANKYGTTHLGLKFGFLF